MIPLAQILKEAKQRPLLDPLPLPVAVAVLDDLLRAAHQKPVPDPTWASWSEKRPAVWVEQMQITAWLVQSTALGATTVAAMATTPPVKPQKRFEAFFEGVLPLTSEMLRNNAVRLEELIRKWADAWEIPIANETPEKSAARLLTIDYRKALVEFERAEQARQLEAERKAKLLAEAAARAAEANSWRE